MVGIYIVIKKENSYREIYKAARFRVEKLSPIGWLKSDFHDNKVLFTQDYSVKLLSMGGEIVVSVKAHCETMIR